MLSLVCNKQDINLLHIHIPYYYLRDKWSEFQHLNDIVKMFVIETWIVNSGEAKNQAVNGI